MKKIIVITLATLAILGTSSCKKFLDINDNPNAATKVTPNLLFNYAATSYAVNRASGDNYLVNAFAIQTVSTGGSYGWGSEDVYDISTYATGNTWKAYYATSGQNLMNAIKIAESSTPALTGSAGQSKILLAQSMLDCTLLFGNVPFSEAWKADSVSYPKFDTQQEVFNSLIALIDQGITDINNGNATLMADIFYNGDGAKWIAAGNSLKLKILMTMVDKDPSKATAIGELVSNNSLIQNASQNWEFPFDATSGNQNPKFRLNEYYSGGNNIWFFGSKVITDPMNAQNDPRRAVYFNDADEDYDGLEQNEEADDNSPLISDYMWRNTAPEVFITYQEVLFYQAEAYARGLGVAQDLTKANELYKDALTAACEYYNVPTAEINTFVAAKSLTTVSDPVKEIHIQQFIDFMDRPIDAFTNWRRSGPEGSEIPTLSIPNLSPNAGLYRRWGYPNTEEIAPNPNAPKDNPQYYSKLWFDL